MTKNSTDFMKKLKRQILNIRQLRAVSFPQFINHLIRFGYFYNFVSGLAPFPLNITLELTYKCNLNCSYCYLSVSKNPLEKSDEQNVFLPYSEIEKLINSIKRKRTSFFLTGGEPTLHPNLPSIINLIKQNHFRCGMVTNGLQMSSDLFDAIQSSRLDYLFFSVDGDQLRHNQNRGENTFDKTIKNIETILRWGKTRPRVIFNIMILKNNYKELHQIIDLAASLKIDCLAFDLLTYLTENEYRQHQNDFEKNFPEQPFHSHVHVDNISEIDYKSLSDQMKSLKYYAKKKKVPYFIKPDVSSDEICRWHLPDFRLERKCVYPWNVARISPNGDVYPCAQYMLSMGNIKNQLFSKIWNGKKFQYFRRKIKKHGLMAGCNRCCKL